MSTEPLTTQQGDSTDYQPMPMVLIREPAHRLRETIDAAALGELADSIAAEGLHQPIGVRGPDAEGAYEIVWGHRRYLAVRLLKWQRITARVFPASYDPLLAAISENLQRTDLTPIEEAHAIARFLERGEARVAIARLFRRSPAWIDARLDLLDLPADLQAAVQDRSIPVAVAHALRDVDYEPYRRDLLDEARRVGATATVAALWTQHYLADRERIVHNELAVSEIAARREAWKIMIACELCHEDYAFEHTRALRMCQDCLTAVLNLVEHAARQATA